MDYFLISLIPFFLYGFLKMLHSFHMLQQNWYNDGNRYLKWISSNKDSIFLSLELAFVVFVCGLFLPFRYTIFMFGAFYTLLFIIRYQERKKEQVKKPLAFTKRIGRLTVTWCLFYIISIITICLTWDKSLIWLYYLDLGLIMYLNDLYVYTINIINKPIEHQVFLHYKRSAVRKLKNMSNMKVIGITGSYGKTSSKNIINDILNVKYNSFPTPKNFNTTYGMIRTINQNLDKFNDFFIAEMGAFCIGEIKEICDLMNPTYGIITTIGKAHLESFGSRENIQKGKFELIESLPSDGVGVLNADDPYQVSYKLKNSCKILWIGIDNKEVDFYAENIKLSKLGTSFDVYIKKENKSYPFTTKLLGCHNIYNILAGIALGYELGMKIEQLQLGVKKVTAVEHRLELKKMGSINLIDDAYNSNPVGAKMALEVLKMMPGKKMIITPGMIELGEEQYSANFEFGKQIAEVCDEVVLIGEKQTKPIYDGLLDKKYSKKKIHILNDVKAAFPLVKKLEDKETYVLIENDLPDLFNE